MTEIRSLRVMGVVLCALVLSSAVSVADAHAKHGAKLGIAFKPRPKLDRIKTSAVLIPTALLQPGQEAIDVRLVGRGGHYFDQTLAAGSLIANGKGNRWKYKRTRDGSSAIYHLALREKLNRATNQLEYKIKIKAEANLAGADPDRNALLGEQALQTMTLQIVIGDDIFALTAVWQRRGKGWKLKQDDFPRASIPLPSGCADVYAYDAGLSVWGDMIQQGRGDGFTIRIERSGGASLDGYTARVVQTQHEFPFGGTINYTAFTPGDEAIKARCLAQADDLWNAVVDESRQKWTPTEPTAGAIDFGNSNEIVQWAQDHDKRLRHHTIFWSNPAQNPAWLDTLDSTAFRQAIFDRIDYFTAGQCPQGTSCVLPDPTLMTSVDVINEMIFWNYYRATLGESDFSGIVKEIYDRVKTNIPAAKLYLNEQPDHVCVFGNQCTALDVDETYAFVTSAYIQLVQDMLADGVVFDGLALQSHFSDPDLNSSSGGPTPAAIVAAYEQAMATASSTLGMPMLVSELDYATNDVCERADFLNRFYHMAFSNDFVEGIFYWGWVVEPQKALLDTACELNPAGELVRYLIHEKWKSRLGRRSIVTGELSADLRFGDYDIEVFDASGQSVSVLSLPLHADSSRIVTVPIL